MNRFWENVLLPIARAAEAQTFCEIGADRGDLTEKILAHCGEIEGIVHVIDPSPALDPEEWQARHGELLVFHRALSLEALPSVGPVDFVLIDGDHNWFTVLNELRLIERMSRESEAPLPVIAMHDVAWPYARRDMYYDPASIPEAHRQPYERQGIHPDSTELVDNGLNAHLENAIQEGTEANGVLTAVEDHIAESSTRWTFRTLHGLSGVGVLVDEARLERQPEVGRALKRLGSVALLRRQIEAVERARILAEIRAANQGRRVRQLRGRVEAEQETREASAEELPSQQQQLEDELADVQRRLEEVAGEHESLRAARRKAEEAAGASEHRVLVLEQARSEAESARDGALQANEAAAAESAQAQAARDQLAARAEELRAELDLARKDLEASLHTQRQAAVDAARAEVHREHLERRAAELRADADTKAAGLDRVEHAAQQVLGELRGELAGVRASLDAARDEQRDASVRAAQAVAQRDELGRRLEHLGAERDRRIEELERARAEAETASEARATAARALLQQVRDELEARRHEHEATALAAAQAEAQRDELTRRLTDAQDAFARRTRELGDELERHERENAEIARRLEAETEARREATALLDQTRDEVDATAGSTAERDDEAGRVARAYDEALGRERALRARLVEERDAFEARLEVEPRRADTVQARQDAAVVVSARDAEEARRELERLRDEVSALRSQLVREEAVRAVLEEHIGTIREEIVRRGAPLGDDAPEPDPVPEPDDSRGIGLVTSRELAARNNFVARYRELLRETGLETFGDEDLAAPWPMFAEPLEGWTPRASIIVCVHNALDDVRRCLASVATHLTENAEVVLVDDGSDEPTARFLDRLDLAGGRIRLVRNETPPHGYTVAANLGLKAASGEYLVLLNSDTIVTAGWLERIIACGEQDEQVGILGPVSNAATHQSVPSVRHEGAWATNPLPTWLTVGGMGVAISAASNREYPRVPFVNGFCFAIKRRVLEAVGYLDEETFGAGYCEENDFSLRARQAGFTAAVVDDAFVFHAKSRSYTTAGRNEHAKRNYQRFLEKHGADTINPLVRQLEEQNPVGALGSRLGVTLEDPRRLVATVHAHLTRAVSPVFVLPGIALGGSGGSHSIVQEVGGMRALGVPAQIAVPTATMERVRDVYDDRLELFLPFDGEDELAEMTKDFEVLVATHFTSVDLVQRLLERRPGCIAAYYVQDYEPFFAEPGSASAQAAYDSYTAIPGQLLFAKTHWLRNIVSAAHHVRVAKVEPSIDHDVYRPTGTRASSERVVITAMVRPRTPRRQPGAVLRLLERLEERFGDRVELVTFGCDQMSVNALTECAAIRANHAGIISRNGVAELLGRSDVFVDLSTYQAFGRTALEAMACGCVPIVPAAGGAWEFAVPDGNAVVVDTSNEQDYVQAVTQLAEDGTLRARLQEAGLASASQYSIERAALSEFAIFAEAMLDARVGAGGRGLAAATQ